MRVRRRKLSFFSTSVFKLVKQGQLLWSIMNKKIYIMCTSTTWSVYLFFKKSSPGFTDKASRFNV